MPGQKTKALVQIGSTVLPAALGRTGLGINKKEGDGITPRATMRLIKGFWRPDRIARPTTNLPMTPLKPGMRWCDDPAHPAYNSLIRDPGKVSCERMWRDDHLYDICLVMDWNITTRTRNRGSAIFMHLARPFYTPTQGCIALSARHLLRLLSITGQNTHIRTF